MADKDFIVKNGLAVNNYAFSVNTTGIHFGNSFFANLTNVNATSNNTSFVGSVSAANVVSNSQLSSNLANYQTTAGLNANVSALGYMNTSANYTISGIHTYSANIVLNSGLIANGSVGSANQVLYSNGSVTYWGNVQSGTSYTKGNQGTVGSASNANNIFRINANTVSNNITFDAQDNAFAVGPITIGTGNTITISTGARVVII